MTSSDPSAAGDDAARLATWQRLVEGDARELARAARAVAPGDVAAVARLRRTPDATPALVSAALDLAEARRRAEGRLDRADAIVADPAAVEQATDRDTARWKAQRFVRAAERTGTRRVIDACCGLGSDAAALVAAGLDVLAVDRDPVRAWMAERNAGCASRCDDVVRLDARGALVHVDPARRDEGRGVRRFDPARWSPTLADAIALVDRGVGGGVKMTPAIDHEVLSGLAPPEEAETEIIGDRRGLRAAMLWLGGAAFDAGARRASDPGGGISIAGVPADRGGPAPASGDGTIGARLLVPHPALERARLVGTALAGTPEVADDVVEPHPGLGLLTTDATPPQTLAGWFDAYDVLDRTPLRERAVRDAVRRHGAREIEVHARGGVADADRLAAMLRRDAARGDVASTGRIDVFALRVGARRLALVTRRARPNSATNRA